MCKILCTILLLRIQIFQHHCHGLLMKDALILQCHLLLVQKLAQLVGVRTNACVLMNSIHVQERIIPEKSENFWSGWRTQNGIVCRTLKGPSGDCIGNHHAEKP